jgi:hypothetical protein
MVAEQAGNFSAGLSGFLLQPHDQVKHSDAVRATVNKITHKPEDGLFALPGVAFINKVSILEKFNEFFQLPMDITEYINRLWR